jgi:hypothetical protein
MVEVLSEPAILDEEAAKEVIAVLDAKAELKIA